MGDLPPSTSFLTMGGAAPLVPLYMYNVLVKLEKYNTVKPWNDYYSCKGNIGGVSESPCLPHIFSTNI